MSQMRVFANVDEKYLGRVVVGGRASVTFRASAQVYGGTISRIAPTVKSLQRGAIETSAAVDGRVVEVEIKLDASTNLQILGREARVTFL